MSSLNRALKSQMSLTWWTLGMFCADVTRFRIEVVPLIQTDSGTFTETMAFVTWATTRAVVIKGNHS